VAEILKVLHLAQQHGVPEMQVGRSGVESRFDAQRNSSFLDLNQALAQFLPPESIPRGPSQVRDLFVNRHSFIRAGNEVTVTSFTSFAVNAGASIGMKCERSASRRSVPLVKLDASSGAVGD